jgi:hypothetical protein
MITYLRCKIGSQFVNHACELAPCTFHVEDERLTAEFAVGIFFLLVLIVDRMEKIKVGWRSSTKATRTEMKMEASP